MLHPVQLVVFQWACFCLPSMSWNNPKATGFKLGNEKLSLKINNHGILSMDRHNWICRQCCGWVLFWHGQQWWESKLISDFLFCHAKQQRVTALQQIVGIASEDGALERHGKQFRFVGPHHASSQTSASPTLHLAKSVVTLLVGLTLSSLIDSSVLVVVCFAFLLSNLQNCRTGGNGISAVAATTCAGIQWQSAKPNAKTQERCT